MQPADLFLREHAFVHTAAVARSEAYNIDYLVRDLSEAELRARPHGMNSLAWLFWHMARVEDGLAGCLVGGRTQVLDQAGWAGRLGISRRDVGTGMTKAEVAELSAAIDLPALWAYRDEVGRQTRSVAGNLWPDRWNEHVTVADIRRAAEAGVVSREWGAEMEEYMPSKTREAALFWWGLHHNLMHLGQATMVRNLVHK